MSDAIYTHERTETTDRDRDFREFELRNENLRLLLSHKTGVEWEARVVRHDEADGVRVEGFYEPTDRPFAPTLEQTAWAAFLETDAETLERARELVKARPRPQA